MYQIVPASDWLEPSTLEAGVANAVIDANLWQLVENDIFFIRLFT